jgi:hypothetical protein
MKTSSEMKHPIDDIVAFISGLGGSSIYAWVCGITWESAWDSTAKLLWIGIVALFSGAMGVLGKHLMGKLFKKKR